MAPQVYKVVSTHAHKISYWTILSRLIHSGDPQLEGINGDAQSDLAILDFKNREQIEDFCGSILRLKQEVMLSVDIVSSTRLIFQRMKTLSKIDKLRAFIDPNMIDITTLLDNNGKSAVYTGGDINGIYSYLEIIGSPNH